AYLDDGGSADFALLDMMMPDMNGHQLATRLRERLGPAELPLLLLSSVGNEELRRLGAFGIFQHVMHKPVRQSALLDALVTTVTASSQTASAIPASTPRFDPDFADAHPLQILVAEDNRVNRKLVQQVLERIGYKPEMVTNGSECVQAL